MRRETAVALQAVEELRDRGVDFRCTIAGSGPDEAALPRPHFPPRARRAVQISLVGGMSHIDSFDHKPGLERNLKDIVQVGRAHIAIDQQNRHPGRPCQANG